MSARQTAQRRWFWQLHVVWTPRSGHFRASFAGTLPVWAAEVIPYRRVLSYHALHP